MLWNIVDRRKREYRWRKINAVIEATQHDNACEDADQVLEGNMAATLYDERFDVSVNDAIRWAEDAPGKVTLYLYDEGEGIVR